FCLTTTVEKIRNKEIKSGGDNRREVFPTTDVTLAKKINVVNTSYGNNTKIMLLVLIVIVIFIFLVFK
ncbi:hypothetical protein CBW54_18645, partial [Yersinia kristensenii]